MRKGAAAIALLVAVACHDSAPVTGPGPGDQKYPAHPGFDISHYPGDGALAAWRTASPYGWVGYYLSAPCHRSDTTWVGRRAQLEGAGWGTAVIYVGQQDWRYIPTILARQPALGRVDRPTNSPALTESGFSRSTTAAAVVCSATLLTPSQGELDGADAAAKTARDGFTLGSTIFLDVEYVSTVDPALLDYVRGWIGGVLADGRYGAGIYTARSNALSIHDAAVAAYAAAGRQDTPRFWIAASSASLGFSLFRRPQDVGFDFATVWQGALDVVDDWGGVRLTIDRNVASTASPTAPLPLAALIDP